MIDPDAKLHISGWNISLYLNTARNSTRSQVSPNYCSPSKRPFSKFSPSKFLTYFFHTHPCYISSPL